MMQELGITLEIIDRCQNHLLGGSKVRRHYLHYDYANEKAEAWQHPRKQVRKILTPKVPSQALRNQKENDLGSSQWGN